MSTTAPAIAEQVLPARRASNAASSATHPTSAEIFATIRPVLEQHRDRGETERKLSRPAVEAMTNAGVFRAMTPRALGGLQLEPAEVFRLVESISQIDGSAGWVAGNCLGFPYLCQMLSDEGAREVLASKDTIIAGGGFPPGAAVPVEGGYRLTARAAFASGSDYATWLWTLAAILDDGQPRMTPEGHPVLLWVFVPREDVEVLGNWDTMGMRATGSHDIAFNDVFVPMRRTFIVQPLDNPGPAFRVPHYRGGIWYASLLLGAVALGIGQSAVDDALKLVREKTASYMANGLAGNAAVQRELGQAAATVGAARAYMYQAVDDIWQHCLAGGRASLEDGVKAQLAASHAVSAGVRAVQLVHEAVGTSGIQRQLRFQQRFRDVNTISQHAFASIARFESTAQVMLGLQSDWEFFYL